MSYSHESVLHSGYRAASRLLIDKVWVLETTLSLLALFYQLVDAWYTWVLRCLC